MNKYADVLAALATRTGVPFRPASSASIAALRKVGLPESIVAFYAEHEPARLVEMKVRFWPVDHIIVENTQAMPGMFSSPVGFPVFATTTFGNAYCFDLTVTPSEDGPPVVLISHETINQEVDAHDVAQVAKSIAHSMLDFLEKMITGTVDEVPIE